MSALSEALERHLKTIMSPKSVAPVAAKTKVAQPTLAATKKYIHLVYQEGTSDKEYIVEVVDVGGEFEVRFQYGRRGKTLQHGTKTAVPVSLSEALNIYYKLVHEKKAKGYEEK